MTREVSTFTMVNRMNDIHRSEISTEIDWLSSRLAPLKNGTPVALQIDRPTGVGKRKNPVVTIVPGLYFGFENSMIVSVLENGSTTVRIGTNKIANLVNAGIPAKLAGALVKALNSLYGE